jgi:hypothetical protein
MPELGPSGSVRGAVSNHRPYRDPEQVQQFAYLPHAAEAWLAMLTYNKR